MRYTSNTIHVAAACTIALVAFSVSPEEPANRLAGPLALPLPSAPAPPPAASDPPPRWAGQNVAPGTVISTISLLITTTPPPF